MAIAIGSAVPSIAKADGICAAPALLDAGLPPYRAEPIALPRDASFIDAQGRVTVVGYNDMAAVLAAMSEGFAIAHPAIRFRFDLPGTRLAPAALAGGLSAFAPMGAWMTPPQLDLFRAAGLPSPIPIRIAHASLDPTALSGPLAIVVPDANPLRAITLEQAAGVFSGRLRTWRDLGVGGEMATLPIHAYGLHGDTVLGREFGQVVLQGTPFDPGMVGLPQSAEVAARVEADAQGIGFAAAMRHRPRLRSLAISRGPGEVAMTPSCAAIMGDQYPLDRFLLIYLPRPISPLAREFVRFALSREGQEAVAASPQGYLPLSAETADAERTRLEAADRSP